MKKNLSFLIAFVGIGMLFSGCGAKPYVDTKSDDYATFQLVPKSETLIFTDDYYAYITDFSKGCHKDEFLGVIKTDSDTPSRVAKIPAGKPLIIKANYTITSNNSTYTEYDLFLLTPEKHKDYVVEYVRKDVSFFKTVSDFYVYEKDGNKEVEIPKSRIRNFDYERECN